MHKTLSSFIHHSLNGSYISTTGEHKWQADITACAFDKGTLIAVSMVGASTSVDAIRANASMGKLLAIYQPKEGFRDYDVSYISTKDNKYLVYRSRLANIRKSHYILLNPKLFEGSIDEPYIWRMSSMGLSKVDSVGHHLREILPVAIFPDWYHWLMTRNEQEAIPAQPYAVKGFGFNIWCIPLKDDQWQEIITEGVQGGDLKFPQEVQLA